MESFQDSIGFTAPFAVQRKEQAPLPICVDSKETTGRQFTEELTRISSSSTKNFILIHTGTQWDLVLEGFLEDTNADTIRDQLLCLTQFNDPNNEIPPRIQILLDFSTSDDPLEESLRIFTR